MKTGIFTVYDTKTEAYLIPFYMPTPSAAQRAVADILRDPEHQFSRHPADYNLFYIGDYDDQTGKIETKQSFRNLGNLLEFLPEEITGVPLFHVLNEGQNK